MDKEYREAIFKRAEIETFRAQEELDSSTHFTITPAKELPQFKIEDPPSSIKAQQYISLYEHNKILQELAQKHSCELEDLRNQQSSYYLEKLKEIQKEQSEKHNKESNSLQKKVQELEFELFELNTQMHSYKLSEEIIKKQYESLMNSSEVTNQQYKENLKHLKTNVRSLEKQLEKQKQKHHQATLLHSFEKATLQAP